jgi:hypothetical protein
MHAPLHGGLQVRLLVTSKEEQALKKAANVVPHLRVRLEELVESVSSRLPKASADQLRYAALPAFRSIERLGLLLSERSLPDPDDSGAVTDAHRTPELDKATAVRFLREIDDMIREMEDEILNPLDDALSVDEDLLRVKRQVGQVWGAMITCLQRPLWLRYPELGPSDDE